METSACFSLSSVTFSWISKSCCLQWAFELRLSLSDGLNFRIHLIKYRPARSNLLELDALLSSFQHSLHTDTEAAHTLSLSMYNQSANSASKGVPSIHNRAREADLNG